MIKYVVISVFLITTNIQAGFVERDLTSSPADKIIDWLEMESYRNKVKVRIPFKKYYFDFHYSLKPSFKSKINSLHKEEIVDKLIDGVPEYLKLKVAKYSYPILDIAEAFKLDPVYLIAMIWTESHFKEKASSNKGALGLMQIMPNTKSYLKKKIDSKVYYELILKLELYDLEDSIKENLILGAFYIKNLKERFKNTIIATAAYNMGPTWATNRLRRRKRVGNSNKYVNKIKKRYYTIVRKF